jgi:hypothetical protein
MGYVYVVQRQFRFNRETGQLTPRYDLVPAEKYGEIRVILSDRTAVEYSETIITKMDLILSNYTSNDYLLLIGHPCLIGWATALAAAHNKGRVRQLIWHGSTQKYSIVESYLPVARNVI